MRARPPGESRWRIPLRVAVIVGSYGLYLLLAGERFGAAVFTGIGTALLGLTAVDRWTLAATRPLRLLQTGTALLGAGLLAWGVYLLVR